MATPRKSYRKVHEDRLGFTRVTLREPFQKELGERFDRVEITYRPRGFTADMITVMAGYSEALDAQDRHPAVKVRWHGTSSRNFTQEPDNFLAARYFARALKDAMLNAERFRRHMGIAEVNTQHVEEWKR